MTTREYCVRHGYQDFFLGMDDGGDESLCCPVCHPDHQDNPKNLPPPLERDDYETCGTCGFDHSYEYEEAVKKHVELAGDVFKKKCTDRVKVHAAHVIAVAYDDVFACVVKHEHDRCTDRGCKLPLHSRAPGFVMSLKDFKASVVNLQAWRVILLKG